MNDEITITQLLAKPITNDLIEDLWFDWWCEDSKLINKGINLLKKLKAISKSPKFDNDKCYVFFKNNCPCVGGLYDDFRICDKETGDVLYCIVPNRGKGRAQVYGEENDFEKPLAEGTWRTVKEWFLK